MKRERHTHSRRRSALLLALVPALCLALGFNAAALKAQSDTVKSDKPETEKPSAREKSRPKKLIVVDQYLQMLYAFEGKRCVLSSPISSGKNNGTPNGTYSVQDKELMHYSRLFDNAPMPCSLQIHQNYFLHGFSEVPDVPASHGCIRVLNAQALYNWATVGTSVVVKGRWDSLRAPIRLTRSNTSRAVRATPADLGYAPALSTATYVPTVPALRPVSVTR